MTRLRLPALFCGGLMLIGIGYATLLSTRTIFDEASPYGRVRVVEHSSGLRQLRTGDAAVLQTALYPDRPRHLESAYTRVAMVGLALLPENPRILFVGLGGGAMPKYTHDVLPAATIDIVEIDPLIVDVAQRFFGFVPDTRMRVYTDDGRAFIERAPHGSYDLIVLDAFAADEVPVALTTHEFLSSVRLRLAAGGVVVANLWSAAPAYPAMLSTYAAVFDEVALVRVPKRRQRILLASVEGRDLDKAALAGAAAAFAERVDPHYDLEALVRHGYEGAPAVRARVLRDVTRPD